MSTATSTLNRLQTKLHSANKKAKNHIIVKESYSLGYLLNFVAQHLSGAPSWSAFKHRDNVIDKLNLDDKFFIKLALKLDEKFPLDNAIWLYAFIVPEVLMWVKSDGPLFEKFAPPAHPEYAFRNDDVAFYCIDKPYNTTVYRSDTEGYIVIKNSDLQIDGSICSVTFFEDENSTSFTNFMIQNRTEMGQKAKVKSDNKHTNALLEHIYKVGPRSLLPHHLTDKLLKALAKGYDDFSQERSSHESEAFFTAVLLLSMDEKKISTSNLKMSFLEDELNNKLNAYGIKIGMEELHRMGYIGLDEHNKETLKTIFDMTGSSKITISKEVLDMYADAFA
jgi:hypothetical protein